MFSVEGTTAIRSIGSPSSAIAPTASSTAAAPDMSIFISCMPAEGLIEMPPVSKVTPLPTRPSVSPRAAAGVAQDDQPRRLLAALADGDQAAHLLRGDLLAAEDLDADRVVRGGDLLGPLGQEGRRGDVDGQALQVAGAVLGLGADAGGLGRARRAPGCASSDQRLERGRRGVLGVLAEEAVEAVGAEDRAGDDALGDRLVVVGLGQHPGERGGLELAGLLARRGPPRPAARSASSSSRLPRPTTSTRPGCSGWIVASFLKAPLASPAPAAPSAQRAGQLLALEEADDEQVGVDLGGARSG